MNSLSHILHTLSYMALPLILAMVFHEYAHGWVAHYYGDPTAKQAGRLTLNPLAHIDPYGTILVPLMCLFLPGGILFGWAKPVPVNPARLRNPRRDMALVAAAGPGMNLLLAVLSALILNLLFSLDPSLKGYWNAQPGSETGQTLTGMIVLPMAVMLKYSIIINIVLMMFNLIPIPPLDGGRVMISLLPYELAKSMSRLEPYGMMILIGLFFFDSHIHVIGTVTGTIVPFMANGIFAQTQIF